MELLTNFIDIYDEIKIEMLGERIYPTRGGLQGSYPYIKNLKYFIHKISAEYIIYIFFK